MIIIVSGFAGCGKSTLAESLAKAFKLKCVHASGMLKELQTKKAKEIKAYKSKMNLGWWESAEGKAFMRKRLSDASMDKALDKKLLQVAGKGNVVLDSWTMSWLYKGKNAFKVWVNCSLDERAKRVSRRDKLPIKAVKEKLKNRDNETKKIYERIYGFSIGEDFGPFSLVVNSDNMSAKQVFEYVKGKIKELER